MKFYLFFGILAIYLNSFCGDPLIFTEVVKLDSTISKSELFSRARNFMSESFSNSKLVLDVQDKESGELIGNGNYSFYSKFAGDAQVRFQIKILVKDGRYKYEFSEFIHKGTCGLNCVSYGLLTNDQECPYNIKCFLCGQKLNNKAWNEITGAMNTQINALIVKLKILMEKPISGSSDW